MLNSTCVLLYTYTIENAEHEEGVGFRPFIPFCFVDIKNYVLYLVLYCTAVRVAFMGYRTDESKKKISPDLSYKNLDLSRFLSDSETQFVSLVWT